MDGMVKMEVIEERWGTWEELLLGGAVLRHGTRDWDVVAAELRTRNLCPFIFTPEVIFLLSLCFRSIFFVFFYFLLHIFVSLYFVPFSSKNVCFLSFLKNVFGFSCF